MNHISFAYIWVRATRPQSNPVIKNIFVWGFIQGPGVYSYFSHPQEGSEGGGISAQTRKRNKDLKTNNFHGQNTKVGIPNSRRGGGG